MDGGDDLLVTGRILSKAVSCVVHCIADTSMAPTGTRSSVQECAISIALMMFGLILERFMTLFKGVLASAQPLMKCDKQRQRAKENKPATVNW